MAKDINTYTRNVGGVRVTVTCPSGAGSTVSKAMRSAINRGDSYFLLLDTLSHIPAPGIEVAPMWGAPGFPTGGLSALEAPNVNLEG